MIHRFLFTYAAAGPDYCYGINCNSSKDEQIASMCYVKWTDAQKANGVTPQ